MSLDLSLQRWPLQRGAQPRRPYLAYAVLAAAVLILTLLAGAAQAQETALVGRLGQVVGEVTLLRGSQSLPAVTGTEVRVGDALATGAEGRAEIVCDDGSTIVLGAATTVSLATFASPDSGPGDALLELIEGILRIALSGERSWRSFEVRSATAVASVRSTDWIVDASRVKTAVFVVEGRVAVEGRFEPGEAPLGSVVLSAGQGTDVPAGDGPGVPKNWGQQRIDDVLGRTDLP